MNECILILDFGGQYKELIARTVRSLNIYSEIRPGSMPVREIRRLAPIGIILTGSPDSVYLSDSPLCDPKIFDIGIPVLGICYGMQVMCQMLQGFVEPGRRGEYGVVSAVLNINSDLFRGVNECSPVLMSHNDHVATLPAGFFNIGYTAGCPNAACENAEKKLYGVQFHPESRQSAQGKKIIENFVRSICGATGDYILDDYIQAQIEYIRKTASDHKILLALSGGVDSSVCAALISRAVPEQLVCIFVDHGFMRMNEGDEIKSFFSDKKLHFIRVNAKQRFLSKLRGIIDPEQKRRLIGEEFIRVFEEQAAKLDGISLLAQGTIYPDLVESGGKLGSTIKSHHNVGGLPINLAFEKIIEPLSGLFKDEVRVIGRKLGLPDYLINRQPFPGPGLAVRVIGELTEDKLDTLRKADAIWREELDKLPERPQQYFAVHTGVSSVGVKGDRRTYDAVIALRAVMTTDFMTCDYAQIPHEVLGRAANRITSEIDEVSRVVYDVTSKPPGTVEWE